MAEVAVLENDAIVKVIVTSNGQVAFDFDFLAFGQDDLRAVHTTLAGVATDLIPGVDFTVDGLEQENGGTIDITASGIVTAIGEEVLIYRTMVIERTTDYVVEFRAPVVNREFDEIFMIMQELRRDLDNGIRLPIGGGGITLTPGEEGDVLGFDAAGNLVPVTTVENINEAEAWAAIAQAAAALAQAGAGAPVFDTVAVAEAYAPAVAPEFLITAYRDSARVPGSGAQWRKVEANPVDAAEPWEFDIEEIGGTVYRYEIAEVVIMPQMLGSKGNGVYFMDGAISVGDNTFTSPSANFDASWIGRPIAVRGAGGVASDTRRGTLVSTIAAINGPTSVELADAAGATVAYRAATTTAINIATNVLTSPAHGFAAGEIIRASKDANNIAKDGQYLVLFDADTAAAAGGNADNFKLQALAGAPAVDITGTTNLTFSRVVEWAAGSDDAAAFIAARRLGRKVMCQPGVTYCLRQPMGAVTESVDLNGATMVAFYADTGVLDGSESVIKVVGDGITVQNGRGIWLGDFIKSQVSFVYCDEGNGLRLLNIEAQGFTSSGAKIGTIGDPLGVYAVQKPLVLGCHFHHNRAGGLFFGNTVDLQIIGCQFHFNGLLGDGGTGYGSASLQGTYPLNTVEVGCHAHDNFRKGIDFHAGVGIQVIGCVALRNKVMGIYAEDTRITGSVIIKGCRVGEMRWYGTINSGVAGEGNAPQMFGIMVGAQTGQGTTAAPTYIHIEGCVINSFDTVAGLDPFPIYQYGTGLSLGTIAVKNCIIRAGQVSSIIGGSNTLGAANGNYYDMEIDGNVLIASLTTGVPIYYRSSRNRKKTFRNNTLDITTANVNTGLLIYDVTAIADNSLQVNGNTVNAPTAGWSAVYDWAGIKRLASEQMKDNIVNNAPWREWDGRIFTDTRTAIPSDGIFWTVGSRVRNANAAGPGTVTEWLRISAALGDTVGVHWLPSMPQYVIDANAVVDVPSLADGVGHTAVIPCAGAALGDFAVASHALALSGIMLTAQAQTGQVEVRYQNETGGVLDPASTTVYVRVLKR